MSVGKMLFPLLCGGCVCLLEEAICYDKNKEADCKSTSLQYESVANVYTSWYVGAGVAYQNMTGKALLDDNVGAFGRSSNANSFGLVKSTSGKFCAALTAGYGQLFAKDYYIGGELCVDLGSRKEYSRYSKQYSTRTIKYGGVVPTAALRLGKVLSSVNCLAHVRLGLTFLDTTLRDPEAFVSSVEGMRIAPIIGAGVEKIISDKCSVKIEGDYRFFANKRESGIGGYKLDKSAMSGRSVASGYVASIKTKTRGYAARVMCVYHF